MDGTGLGLEPNTSVEPHSGISDLGASEVEVDSLDEEDRESRTDSAVNLLSDERPGSTEDSGVLSLTMDGAAPLTLEDDGLDSDGTELSDSREDADSLSPPSDLFAAVEERAGEVDRLSDPDLFEPEDERTEIFSPADFDRALIPPAAPPPPPTAVRSARHSEPVPDSEAVGVFEDASDMVSELEELDLDADDVELIDLDDDVEVVIDEDEPPAPAHTPPPIARMSVPPPPSPGSRKK